MWDYIIVGAGSAGCVLANRLSADSTNKVLLVEAGGNDKGATFRIPMAAPLKALGNPATDWMDLTAPDATRNDRTDLWSRGKVLGGSSSLNGMMYVRGNRGDYDHWAQLGCTGWDYESILASMRKLEHGDTALPNIYGRSGELWVSRVRGPHPLTKTFIEAMKECGVPHNPEFNGDVQTGASFTHLTQHKGVRWSASRAFLDPIRARKNLKILTGVQALKVVFEGKRAVGVELTRGRETFVERADGEIILAASTFNSPKLLMLSGVGDPLALEEFGIPLVQASSRVGEDLHEHPGVAVKALVNVRTINMEADLKGQVKNGLRYLLTRSGPATYSFPAIAFARLREESEYPDIQIHFGPYAFELGPTGVEMLPDPAVMMLANVNRSRSRGQVRLRSKDPMAPVIINPNLLGDPYDLELLIAAAKFSRRVLRSEAFAPYFVNEYLPGEDIQTDAQWEAFVRDRAVGSYHPCGTVRMGSDLKAVVDPRLKVNGVERLRVADSSVIPQVPSGNINAISLAIGQKGAEMILQDRQ